MRVFGVAVGVILTVGILWGVVWFNRYSPTARQAEREAKKAAEAARQARIAVDEKNDRAPQPPETDESAHEAEPPPVISKEGPYPKAVIAETRFDFGSMARDEQRKHTFTIKNEGEAPLLLTRGATNCKCTISSLSQSEVAPGKTVDIELSWTPRDLDPNFRKEARIQTNDPDNSEIRLYVNGKVVQEFIVAPTQWNFGNVAGDTPVEVTSTITSALADSFKIQSVESSHPMLSTESTPLAPEKLKLLGAKSGYEFKTKLAAGIPVGPFAHHLKIHSDLLGGKVIDVQVKAFRAGPLRFLPAMGAQWTADQMTINLGRFIAAQGKTATLPLFVQGLKEEFKLTEVTADPKFLKVTLDSDQSEDATKRTYRLIFEVPPGQQTTAKTVATPGRVVLKTNHPDASEIIIDVLFVSF